MEQLSLLPCVKYGQAEDFYYRIQECRSDYLGGYIKATDKPVGMTWDFWYDHVIEGV